MYRHPSPSGTNPHWETEIAAGPALVSRGRKRATTNTTNDGRRGLKTSATVRSDVSDGPSSVDLSSIGGSRDGRVDSKLHFQQYQRDDEEPPLGFTSMETLGSTSTLGASSHASRITRPQRAHIHDPSYASPKNPQVNDLHPAIATNIHSRAEAKYLMQPPPTADFMSGKSRSSRSRSDSGNSSRVSARAGVPLSREVNQRTMERRLRIGEPSSTPTLSHESTIQYPKDLGGQRHDRNTTDEKDFALEDSPAFKPRRRPFSLPAPQSEDSTESAETVIHSPDLAPEPIRTRRIASKPQLSTIASESAIASDTVDRRKENRSSFHSDTSIPERDRNARRSALLVKDDSLKVLKELAPHSAIFKTKIVSSQDLTKDAPSRPTLPRQDTSAERDLEGGAELFANWHSSDFTLPEWVHEHTKREVKHRWSMDI